MLLRGRTALVTGGNSGIGKAIVQAFHREGARVAINFVADRDGAVRLADEVGGIAIEAEVSDEQAVAEMVRTVVDQLGSIDILVNNAGFAEVRPFVAMTAAQWDRMIAVHLRGTFLCSRYTVPLRRFGQPHEVAAAAVFLASDQASYFTGQTNGGDVML